MWLKRLRLSKAIMTVARAMTVCTFMCGAAAYDPNKTHTQALHVLYHMALQTVTVNQSRLYLFALASLGSRTPPVPCDHQVHIAPCQRPTLDTSTHSNSTDHTNILLCIQLYPTSPNGSHFECEIDIFTDVSLNCHGVGLA